MSQTSSNSDIVCEDETSLTDISIEKSPVSAADPEAGGCRYNCPGDDAERSSTCRRLSENQSRTIWKGKFVWWRDGPIRRII